MDEKTLAIKTVLLADDDEDDRYFLAKALKEVAAGLSLPQVENGLEVMDWLNAAPILPDLIFLDLNMPLRNGFECLREIKSDPSLARIPIVIFSTSIHGDSVNEVYTAGASLYIVKPNHFESLKRLVQNVLAIDWKLGPSSRENFILQT